MSDEYRYFVKIKRRDGSETIDWDPLAGGAVIFADRIGALKRQVAIEESDTEVAETTMWAIDMAVLRKVEPIAFTRDSGKARYAPTTQTVWVERENNKQE